MSSLTYRLVHISKHVFVVCDADKNKTVSEGLELKRNLQQMFQRPQSHFLFTGSPLLLSLPSLLSLSLSLPR